jgi:hypothetical protein
MKKLTLDLTLNVDEPDKSPLLLNVRKNISGNIELVIEILANTMHRDNVLVDVRSFRHHNGTYEFKSRNGLLGHTRVLDILSEQSGLLMIRPGEIMTFHFMEHYIHFFNQPTLEDNAYLQYIVSREKLRKPLDRKLEDLRKGLMKKTRIKKTGLGLNPITDWSPSDEVISPTKN